jgi:hypothetical protein
MKNKLLFILILVLAFTNCDKEYSYEVKNTTWLIQINWNNEVEFTQSEPSKITFYENGTTSWGGTWYKTDELTFEWTKEYLCQDTTTTIYYGMFRKNLNELIGHCVSSKKYFSHFERQRVNDKYVEVAIYENYEGDFFAYKFVDN